MVGCLEHNNEPLVSIKFFYPMSVKEMSPIFFPAVQYNLDKFHHLSQLLTLSIKCVQFLDYVGTPTLQLSFLCPFLSNSVQQRSLSYLSLSNSSLRSQLQTKRSFPTRHLSNGIHSTSHAYQTCQLTNGGVG